MVTEVAGPRRRFSLSPPARVWILDALMAGATVGLVVRLAAAPLRPGTVAILPWWAMAALFATAEIFVVHVRFRRNTHTLSLNELPLVLGFFFSSPVAMVVGMALGSALTLRFHRRQATLKLAFNVNQLTLATAVALTVFEVIPGGRGAPVDWLAAFAAASSSALVSVVMTTVVIGFAEGQFEPGKQLSVLAVALIGALSTSSLALVGVSLADSQPFAVILLVVPIAVLFVAYGAYLGDRQRAEEVSHLYEASRTFQEAQGAAGIATSLLDQSSRIFRAQTAAVVLVPADPEVAALRSLLREGGEREVLQPIGTAVVADLEAVLRAGGRVLDQPELLAAAARAAGVEHLRNGLLAPLQGQSRLLGLLVVGDRPAEVGEFKPEHLRLLQTLAGHATTALAKGHLEDELRHRAFHDPLTNLPNRNLFADRVAHALRRSLRSGESAAVLFVDLDDFKAINDTRGHSLGDQLLVAVADRLNGVLRPEDTASRFGGDEFVILLEGVDGEADAALVADRVVAAMEAPFALPGLEVRVKISVGVALSRPGIGAEDLIVCADAAMYVAKQRGKGRCVLYEDSMKGAVVERYELIQDLRGALPNREFVLRFQPIEGLVDRRPVAVETLIRWQHPKRGLLGPDSFVGLAEETGLIVELDFWVIEEASRRLVEWGHAGWGGDLWVTVNISGHQLQQAAFAARVQGILERTGLDPRRLVLEVTEGVLITDFKAAQERLEPLRRLGVQIAIDDFGTGYSSLASLQHFPVDILKIAKPFVDDLLAPAGAADPSRGESFLRAIVNLATTLRLRVIAEGIETEAQAVHLRDLDCAMGQGYHLARPLDEPALREYLLPVEAVL